MAFQHCVLSKKKTKRKLLFVLDHSAEEVVLSVLHPSSIHWDKSIFEDSLIQIIFIEIEAINILLSIKSKCEEKIPVY